MAHPNAEVIRRGFHAFVSGDLETARSIFRPDAVWHVAGHGPLSGDYRGFDAIARWGGQLVERSGGTFREELLALEGYDHWAVQVSSFTAERKGRRIQDQSVNVYHMAHGLVTECWVTFGDTKAFDEFWT